MKRIVLITALLFLSFGLYAGDIAAFVDLGFSSDAKYFMFAQYGVNDKSLPYADIYTINVASNRFVPGGVVEEEYTIPITTGQEGFGALVTLMRQGDDIALKYGINHMRTGRLVYILLNGEEPQNIIQFRDFQTGNYYSITLRQSSSGTGDNVSSSFFITATVERPAGKVSNYTVGLPDYKRRGVKGYIIRKILAAAGDNALIFVIEKSEAGPHGSNVRYMVETLPMF